MTSRTQRRAWTRFEPGPQHGGSNFRPRHGALALSGRRATTAILLSILMSCASVVAETGRPNIVILFADDLGYGSVSWYGGDIPTPNIDSIAKNGIGFTSGYMTAPVCNPSRPGLMTGRYQQRWGKELNSQTVASQRSSKRVGGKGVTAILPKTPRLSAATR